jgi:glycosyltransferase involved in cell wall biosynthesis
MPVALKSDAGRMSTGVQERFGPTASRTRRQAPVAEPADVLAVNRVGYFGGVERVILTAASGAAAHGWSTALACPPGDLARVALARRIAVQQVDVCSLSIAQIGRSPAAWARTAGEVRRAGLGILRAASAARVRIIHTHHPAVALQARRAARLRNTPLVWHVHEAGPIPLHYRGLAAIIARSCDMLLCVSDASRSMVRQLGAPEDRIRLVYNAVEPRFFENVRATCARPAEGPNVGLFGVLEPRKGHADLIRACAALAERWPTLHLWIVGGPGAAGHKHYRAHLEELAQQLGIGARVHFTGRREDIPKLMSVMDAVVSASVCSESLPTALIEACALGVPVLGTDVGGTREIIRHGDTGLLAPAGAPAALASHLAVLLSPAGQSLAQRAREDAAMRFSPGRFAADIDACYREIARRHEERPP